MSRGDLARRAMVGSFPRVSGDEPLVLDDGQAFRAFSPRERG